jgi:hypothetical protein
MTYSECFIRFGQAFESRDREAWDAETTTDITMVPVPGWPDPGPFVGRESAWNFMVGTEEPFAQVIYKDATELQEDENTVFVCANRQVQPPGAGELVDIQLYMVATVSEAGVSRIESFLDRSQALTRAGLA